MNCSAVDSLVGLCIARDRVGEPTIPSQPQVRPADMGEPTDAGKVSSVRPTSAKRS